MDLTAMSVEQLQALQAALAGELKKREKTQKAEALKKVREAARESGFTLEQLFEARPARPSRATGVAKYRNPADTSQTWTGRGRKPGWVIAWLAVGKPIDKLEI